MNQENFNMSLRKFLKTVGVRSQTETERAVVKAIADGKFQGNETFAVRMSLTIDSIGLAVTLDGEIKLE